VIKSLKFTACLALVGLLAVPVMAQDDKAAVSWPSVRQQLQQDKVKTGSALEQLIRANQDFQLLSEREAKDNIRVPAWLRVLFHKNNPDFVYNFKDPAGGYPHALKEIHEWMLTHQDLQIGQPDVGYTPEGDLDRASVTGEKRISGSASNSRSESDIRLNPWNTSKVISASNNIGGSGTQAQYYSTDGGLTWGLSFLSLQTGDSFHSDPTVDWTSDSTAWSSTLGINSGGTTLKLRVYKSTNSGATWTFDNTASGTQTNVDKQMMWVDHSATSTYKDRIYLCWHNGAPAYANVRTTAWGTPIQISGSETTGTAIGCDVKSNSNGDAFVFWPDTGSRGIYVVKSTNGGGSWSAPLKIATSKDSYDIGVPSFNSRRILIYTYGAAYRNGSRNLVYVSWTDLTGATGCTTASNEPGSNTASTCKTRIWFARSADGGATWSAPYMVNNQSSLNDQYNQALAVDESTGNVAIIYYDTVNDSTRKKSNVWYQVSTNDGVSFGAAQQIASSATDETIAGADSGNQYGDYNGLTGASNLFFPSWTDRRSGAKEEIWTAAINEGGGPCTPPAAPTGLSASAVSSSQINLSWSAVSGASSYNVYRSTSSGGTYTSVGSSATTSFSNTGLAGSTTYYYKVTAVGGCESGYSAVASATTSAPPSCTNTTLYSNNFDAATGMSDWTKGTFLSGGSTVDWRGVQTCTAASGTKIFRFGNTGCTTDYINGDFNFAIPKGSTGIVFGAAANTSRLTFKHRRAFESGYDGGTLYVSINGTTYTAVPASAILAGSYNGTTSTACPPTGGGSVAVWTGTSTTFTTTTVNLDAACNAAGSTSGCAGKTVRIAFASITDCSTTGDGWFLDDVTVTDCQ